MSMFLCSLAARADIVRILDDPKEAAQVRADVIQQAQRKVSAVYFLARNDEVTLTALALLRDAKRRGVGEVRLIVDANFNRIPKAMLAHLREEGVVVRVYHPLRLNHPSWLFRRMHEKAVIVDSALYITGGRNLAKSYFGLARKNYLDRDVYVEGPSAVDADRHFEALWVSRQVAELRVHVSRRERRRASALLDHIRAELEAGRGLVQLDTNRHWGDGRPDVPGVRFLHDPIMRNAGPRVATRLAQLIEAATSSIIIESPYLVPSRALLELLERKRKEGVVISILTNSLRSTDGVLPQAGYLKYKRRLLRAGIELHEFKGPDILHAKSAVIDEKTILIGSYNIDPRSQNLNMEVMCAADDEGLAQELMESIGLHRANAWHITPAGALPDGERYAVSRRRVFGVWAIRLLLPIVEKQL
jgi:phosphatidylserine/phosphatidylglycerophosphate/cardiolipin synthase-like enzyme